MRITRKLGLLVGCPLVAVVGFAALAVVTTYGSASQAEQLRRLVAASATAGELVHQLQAERADAVLLLTGQADGELFADQVAATDAAATAYTRARDGLPELPAGTAGLVGRIDGQLARLDGLRQEVTGGGGRASAVAFSYRIAIAALLSFRESVGQAGGASAEVADHLRAAAAISQASEAVGLLDLAVLRAGQGPLSPATVQEITAARTARLQAQQDFDAFATPSWRAALERTQVGEAALVAQELEDAVARTPAGARLRLDIAGWAEVMSARTDRLHEVEKVIDADILAEVTTLRDAQRRLAAVQVAAVLLAAAAALTLAVGLGRPVVAGLRRLRDAADRVAHRELPDAVARLESQREQLGNVTAEQFADQTPAPIEVRGRDELAELAASFNSLHREAVRTAAGQALLRLLVGQIFVSLARRGQQLAGQLTAAMDDLERDEEDPQRLRRLFEVDNGITLLARANESLLVLGGAGAGHQSEHDEALNDVLKAAAGRVRNYDRVHIGLVDEAAVVAGVVDDLVLLLAELVDNAARFSPPDTVVVVSARWLGNRAVVQVADEGMGMPDQRRAELNSRLASRPPLDLQAVRQMGLTVVSRLAQRHQIGVQLYPNAAAGGRGTMAEVTLPAGLVTVTQPQPQLRLPVAAGGPRAAAAVLTAAEPAVAGAAAPRGGGLWPPYAAAVGSATVELPTSAGMPSAGSPPLLVFEQVSRSRSMWFTPADEAADPVGQPSDFDKGETTRGWQTAADAGWQAAAAAADPTPAGTTASGLPKRQPSAQLVPGGVGQPAALAVRPRPVAPGRVPDPARVAAAAAAFSRGLAAGVARPAYPRQRSSPETASANPMPRSTAGPTGGAAT